MDNHPRASALQVGPESRYTVRVDDGDVYQFLDEAFHTFDHVAEAADFRPQQMGKFTTLAGLFFSGTARPFDKIEHAGWVILKTRAGSQGVVPIGIAQFWISLDLCLGGTLYVRETQYFHSHADKGHPDQGFFGEKLKWRNNPVEM